MTATLNDPTGALWTDEEIARLRRGLVEAIPPKHPLGADPHVLPEEPLQRAGGPAEPFGHVVDFGDGPVVQQRVNDPADARDFGVRYWPVGAQVALGGGDQIIEAGGVREILGEQVGVAGSPQRRERPNLVGQV